MLRMLSLLLVFSCFAAAEVRLAKVFTDHMVLQRDKQVRVWGFGDSGNEVTVTFAGAHVKAKTDDHGRWQVELPAMPVNAHGQSLTVTCGTQTI